MRFMVWTRYRQLRGLLIRHVYPSRPRGGDRCDWCGLPRYEGVDMLGDRVATAVDGTCGDDCRVAMSIGSGAGWYWDFGLRWDSEILCSICVRPVKAGSSFLVRDLSVTLAKALGGGRWLAAANDVSNVSLACGRCRRLRDRRNGRKLYELRCFSSVRSSAWFGAEVLPRLLSNWDSDEAFKGACLALSELREAMTYEFPETEAADAALVGSSGADYGLKGNDVVRVGREPHWVY